MKIWVILGPVSTDCLIFWEWGMFSVADYVTFLLGTVLILFLFLQKISLCYSNWKLSLNDRQLKWQFISFSLSLVCRSAEIWSEFVHRICASSFLSLSLLGFPKLANLPVAVAALNSGYSATKVGVFCWSFVASTWYMWGLALRLKFTK